MAIGIAGALFGELWFGGDLAGAGFAPTTAVAATGAPGGAGAITVAPGPASTRVTFKLLSGSTMTRAYNLRAVTCSMASRSGSRWKLIPDNSRRSQLTKSSCKALSIVWTPATLISEDTCSVGLPAP